MPIKGKAKFITKSAITESVYEFVFEMIDPVELDFKAGQYVSVTVGENTRRPYSISTSPLFSKTTFQIILDIIPNGIGVKYLMSLKTGQVIDIIGNIGLFTMPDLLSQNLYFLGTGTGIGPLKSMIETLILSKKSEVKIGIHFGTRTKKDIFYESLFAKYKQEGKISDYKIYLSREKVDGYEHGYISKFIDNLSSEQKNNGQFFVCGSGHVVKAVDEYLRNNQVSESQIYYEKFS